MISVIMLSNLGHYEGARSESERKFIRAVDSYVQQITNYQNELIIVSDGCSITSQLYDEHYSEIERISLIEMPKSPEGIFPGSYRQVGIDAAKYDIISYLDSDDMLLPNRLNNCVTILVGSGKKVILDSIYIYPDVKNSSPLLQQAKIKSKFTREDIPFNRIHMSWSGSTAQLVHYKNVKSKWKDGGRGEDGKFVNELLGEFKYNKGKVYYPIGGYAVCHHPTFNFDV